MHRDVRAVFQDNILYASFLYICLLLSACFHVENHPPTANASVNKLTPFLGEVIILDASLSSDVDGDHLIYEWEIIVRPVDSQSELSDPAAKNPTLNIDKDGAYQIKLVVSDGKIKSKADFINLSTVNSTPKAIVSFSAPTQNGKYIAGDTIELDAAASFDPENQTLFYHWELTAKPSISSAVLSNDSAVKPNFIADVAGQYVVLLVVDDGVSLSITVSASFEVISANDPPFAMAKDITELGTKNYIVGDVLLMDGSASYDPEGQPLIYRWEIFEKPENSSSIIIVNNAPRASFTSDKVGDYIIHLIVEDGVKQSESASVIYEIAPAVRKSDTRPFAEAGFDQPLYSENTIVTLDGSRSYDIENDFLIYKWELLVKPEGSSAVLSSLNLAKPQFTADVLGSYVATLVVSDINGDSHFDSVVVTPHENPGLACGDCHNDEIARGQKVGHLLAYDDCAACHFSTNFLPTRGTFHAHGHKAQPSQCIICHDGISAKTKPVQHMETDKECNACHLLSNGTWVPALRVPGKPGFSHRGIFSGCIKCHDDIIQKGKPEGHMPASTRCNACHASNVWTPARHLEHTQALGPCRNCHDPDQDKRVQPIDHLKTTNECLACHAEPDWVPVLKVDHKQVVGSCASCHDGVTASGKPSGHIVSSTFCDKCHDVDSWFTIKLTHNFFTGSCVSCHDGIQSAGAPSSHVQKYTEVCDACHSSIVWRPVMTVDHSQVIGRCIDCHNNVTAPWKNVLHVNTTNECDACHVPGAYKPAAVMDHNLAIGACVDCHNGVISVGQSATHIPIKEDCEVCHSTTTFVHVFEVNHDEVKGECVACHDNVIARGQPAFHLNTLTKCGSCHSTIVYLPADRVKHSEVIGECIDCHGSPLGIPNPPVPASHAIFPNVSQCGDCHNTRHWRVINFPVNHELETTSCAKSGCHDGVATTGQVDAHIPTSSLCEACHDKNRFANVQLVDHLEVIGECVDCHNNIRARGQAALHLDTTNQCGSCHAAVAWVPVSTVEHNEINGDCLLCHNSIIAAGKLPTHIKSSDNCEYCHAKELWLPVTFTSAGHYDLKLQTCIASGCHASGLSHDVSVIEDCSSCHTVANWLNSARPTTSRAAISP